MECKILIPCGMQLTNSIQFNINPFNNNSDFKGTTCNFDFFFQFWKQFHPFPHNPGFQLYYKIPTFSDPKIVAF